MPEIEKYPMKSKNEKPLFNYLVRGNMTLNYYLFSTFDDALVKMREISLSKNEDIALMYEIYFDKQTKEYYGQNTFSAYDGKIEYDKYKKPDLHIEFYVNAGLWMNPNKEWYNILSSNT